MRAALLAHQRGGMFQKFPARARRASVRPWAENAGRYRPRRCAEKRVGQRVQPGIGIGMAFEAVIVRQSSRRTARHDRRA